MADSQLVCMEDGRIGVQVPETRPEFYYSEEQRAAIEELLKNGDGAFKMRLKDDNMKDFLSAREVKMLNNNFRHYDGAGEGDGHAAAGSSPSSDSGVHSTYWPQMSDTEVPPLDIGWPSWGFFKGVTRVAVHTHPPKDNGPHIKEVVRRLIQGASKVIAIVMDLLTDLQILQDLMDAAWRRSVPIYILLDNHGVPHFLDMCSRLHIGAQHLRNIRARTLTGVGFNLSFGRLPGSMCSKYMLVDGEKVVFGSYSFSWSTSRMDRNTITVMTGQVVEFFDQDFRELYAVSEKLDLFREFHVSPPANVSAAARAKAGPKRPPLPATTSRFQVSLGDARKVNNIEVPAHKYYNPKYFLLFPDVPHPARSLQGPTKPSELLRLTVPQDPVTSSEKLDRLSPLPSEAPVEFFKKPNGVPQEKKRLTLKQKITKRLSSSKLSINSGRSSPAPAGSAEYLGSQDPLEVKVKSPANRLRLLKRPSTLGPRSDSVQTVDTTQDNLSMKSHHRSKQVCKVS
ncbi:protein FAM83F-like [Hippocampus zosterae]|uniref:protein FAM83F-like n=1 Tax=Hippocampus zosterae TaxID=109293 RepID=UPI00223D2DE1|nr:protein FAM83F-like [Hippocampus zosterae]XP_051940596.1 protein FAM83F-like [Hippocampus zosterae]